MASTTNCVYKTINLSAGESYVLPVGAEIVYVSDSTGVTSENGCAPIPTDPGSKCYMFQFLFSDNRIGDEKPDRSWEYFTYGGMTASFNIDNTRTGFALDGSTTGICFKHATEIWNVLHANSQLSPLVLGVAVFADHWDNGDQYGVLIKVVDVFPDAPIMGHIDTDTYNIISNASPDNARTESVGKVVDCGVGIQESGTYCVVRQGNI